jgi:DNA primase
VNGPETELFSKRRNLYGLDQAREAMRAGATLLVVEGYIDVIALHQAGFRGAVAPLGTALTDEQLEAMKQERLTNWLAVVNPVVETLQE